MKSHSENSAVISILTVMFICTALAGCFKDAETAFEPGQRATDPGKQSSPDGSESHSVGSMACKKCHTIHFQLWDEGGHRPVACEGCHGPAGHHATSKSEDNRPKMVLPVQPDLCMTCHGPSGGFEGIEVLKIEGFVAHLRFVSEKHSVEIDIEKAGESCTYCHDPHSLN